MEQKLDVVDVILATAQAANIFADEFNTGKLYEDMNDAELDEVGESREFVELLETPLPAQARRAILEILRAEYARVEQK